MEQALAELIWKQRLVVIVLVTFAVLAVLLAAVGVYGVTSYAVAQRTHEVGVRLALGASTQDVLWQLLGQGMLIVVVGLALGLIGSLGLMRLIRSLLFGVEPTDATTLATVSLLLTGVTLVACYVPVRRATRIDPVTALRHE
jgi:putative ABC transport system permease protein